MKNTLSKQTLSVVITTRNRYDILLTCIESILASTSINFLLSVVIVDDFSSDETKNMISQVFKNIPLYVIHNNKNEMMVRSRNKGGSYIQSDYIAFVDDDNIVYPDMLSEMVQFMNINADVAVVGPEMYYLDNTKYLNYQQINLYTGRTKGFVDQSEVQYFKSDGIPNVFLVRGSVFRDHKFDESLYQTFTEPDYAFMLKKYGWKTIMIKAAKTLHLVDKSENFKERTIGFVFSQKSYALIRNRFVLVKRYGNFHQKIIFFMVSIFWPVAYTVLAIRSGNLKLSKNYWLGYRDGLRYFLFNKLIWSYK